MAEPDDNTVQPTVDKPRKRLTGVLAILVLTLGAGVAGTILSPRLMAMAPSLSKSPRSSESKAETEPRATMDFAPLVIDVKDAQQISRHVRIGISVEVPDSLTREEFKNLVPRGREAAIAYLRAKSFEFLTDSASFEKVSSELNARITRAMGHEHTLRVLITDYVSQ